MMIRFLWNTGCRADESCKLKKIDLIKKQNSGYFLDCKHDSDGEFYLAPKFSQKLWNFIG